MSNFVMTPKYIHTIFIHKFFFLKTPKILKFKILNAENDPSLRMYENIRVTPLGEGVRANPLNPLWIRH